MPSDADRLGSRILIVEDDPLMQELLEVRLTLAGYRATLARDGYHALERMRENMPNAILLDINMPRMDGFTVLREMKKFGYLGKAPVMVLTARNQPTDVQEAIRLGASDFLTKPFVAEVLLARVARLLRRSPSQ